MNEHLPYCAQGVVVYEHANPNTPIAWFPTMTEARNDYWGTFPIAHKYRICLSMSAREHWPVIDRLRVEYLAATTNRETA